MRTCRGGWGFWRRIWEVEDNATLHLYGYPRLWPCAESILGLLHYWNVVDEKLEIDSPCVPISGTGIFGWRKTHLSQMIITFIFTMLAVTSIWVRILEICPPGKMT